MTRRGFFRAMVGLPAVALGVPSAGSMLIAACDVTERGVLWYSAIRIEGGNQLLRVAELAEGAISPRVIAAFRSDAVHFDRVRALLSKFAPLDVLDIENLLHANESRLDHE